MKIKNVMVCLHLKAVGSEIDYKGINDLDIQIHNKDDYVYLKIPLPSSLDDKMPDITPFIGQEIYFATKDVIIKGTIENVVKSSGQDIYIFGKLINECNCSIYGDCSLGYWNVIPCEPQNPMVITPFTPIQIPLDEYLNMYDSVNELYLHIRNKCSSLIESLPLHERPTELSIEGLERFLRETIGKILWLKNNQPDIYKELISVLENKNKISETEQKNKQ